MNSTTLMTFVAVLGLTMLGCGSDVETISTSPSEVPAVTTIEESSETVTVSGELTYRQRIALLPGSSVRITIEDVSRADAPADIVAEQSFDLDDGQQVPIPFEIVADRSEFVAGNRYSVRATITGPNEELRWTTDTANPVDPDQRVNALGQLNLVQVAGG